MGVEGKNDYVQNYLREVHEGSRSVLALSKRRKFSTAPQPQRLQTPKELQSTVGSLTKVQYGGFPKLGVPFWGSQ